MSEQSGSWQPDPFGRHQYRYWDGAQWTDQVANDGVTSVDPPVASDASTGDAAESDTTGADSAPPADTAHDGGPEVAAVPPTEPVATTPPAEPQGWAAPDATTAMAAPPPAAPAAPGGPTGPAEPPADTGGNGGGGSNLPGIIVGVVILLALIGAAVWFFVLRDDDDDARARVVSSLQDEFDLSSSEANCVADELDDSLDLGQLASDIEAGRTASDSQRQAMFAAFDACNVDLTGGDGTTTTTDDDTTDTTEDDDDASGPGTSIPSAMLDMIAQGIMQESGLSQTQARCFAEEMLSLDEFDLNEILADPDGFADQMGQPDADLITAFFGIFERCDIDPTEFGGPGGPSGPGGTGDGFQSGMSYGDNPALDALWDACEDGDGAACDELYFTSEIGSEYEEFGDTCGNRVPAGTVLCEFEDLS